MTAPPTAPAGQRETLTDEQIVAKVRNTFGAYNMAEVGEVELVKAIRAALQGPVPTPPEGWVMVPVEPTAEQCAAAQEQYDYDARRGTATLASNIYRAMLAAAQPGVEAEEGE